MDMTGEYRIPAPRETVWKALNDPDVLKQCIPGCETLDKKSDTEFAATVTAKVGPVKAKFGGNVKMSDLGPPNGYTISGEGSGGAAGFAKGGAKVKLAEDGGATVLSYTVNATVGGKLAQIGSRLIDSTAKKMANDFFSKFAEVVGGSAPAAAAPAAETPTPAPAPVAEPGPKKGLPAAVWVIGVIVILALLMWVFQS
jgi:carbon monoxide dehydrogenase subunit G